MIFVITGEPWLRDGVAQGDIMAEMRALGCQFCWFSQSVLPVDINRLIELPLTAIGFELKDKKSMLDQQKRLAVLHAIASTMEWQLYGFVTQHSEVDSTMLSVELDALIDYE